MDFKPLNIDLNTFPDQVFGNDGIATAISAGGNAHPMEDMDYKHLLKEEMEKSQRLKMALGYQQVLKNSLELNMCAKTARLPGMPSSMLAVEILMDKLDSLQSYEYMNVEKPKNEFGIGGLHSHLEKEFRI